MTWSKPKIAGAGVAAVVAGISLAGAAFFLIPSATPQVATLTYLDDAPQALAASFDAAPGVPRVVLLASPA